MTVAVYQPAERSCRSGIDEQDTDKARLICMMEIVSPQSELRLTPAPIYRYRQCAGEI